MSTDLLKFPSGRSVGNCRNDAKRLARREDIPLHLALDRVAVANGMQHPWARAMTLLGADPAKSANGGMSVEDIRAVMAKWPTLNHFGFDVSRRSETPYHELLADNRERLLGAADECNRAARFLKHVERRKTINPKAGSSYGLKHQVEFFSRAFRNVNLFDQYVANGSFICAALHLGLDFQPVHIGGPNVFLNISSRSPIFEWRRLKDRASWHYFTPKDAQRLDELERAFGLQP